VRALAAATALSAVLAGCANPGLYLDRRDTIVLSGGDSIAANVIEQTVDPWPPHSGDNRLAENGQRMQGAVERYRTNKVTIPINPTTSTAQNQQAAVQAQAAQLTQATTQAPIGTPAAAIAATPQ